MNLNTVTNAHTLSWLQSLPCEVANTCVTSPPYYGLRDYGTSAVYFPEVTYKLFPNMPEINIPAMECSLGLEQTPEAFIGHLVAIFREVKRVLKHDGTLWVNIADSYTAGNNAAHAGERKSRDQRAAANNRKGVPEGLKQKDLIGIPWLLAFALRSDGWYLRQDIIWHKPNPMPESVTDRCTKAHEYIFLLSKSAKYYYDHQAILEVANYDGRKDTRMKGSAKYANGYFPTETDRLTLEVVGHERWKNKINGDIPARNKRSVWTISTKPLKEAHFAAFPPELIEPCILAGCPIDGIVLEPFAGSNTTGITALKLHRNFLAAELNPDYLKISDKRDHNENGLFSANHIKIVNT